jgi:hypothetical protein
MGDYLINLFFEPVPKDVRGKYKLVVILIRISEAMVIFGVGLPWYYSRALGAEHSGLSTGSGRVILLLLVGSNILLSWRPWRVPLSQYAWGMAFVGAVSFVLAYNYASGDPQDIFGLMVGIYLTIAGCVLRFVLGCFLGHQLQKEEKVMTLLGLRDV